MTEAIAQVIIIAAGIVTGFIGLGRLHFATKLKALELEKTIEEARTQRERERGERELKLATELAAYQKETAAFNAQTAITMASLVTGQKKATITLAKAQKAMQLSGTQSANQLTGAITEVLQGIVKLASGQVDQTQAIDFLRQAVNGLAEMLQESQLGEKTTDASEPKL